MSIHITPTFSQNAFYCSFTSTVRNSDFTLNFLDLLFTPTFALYTEAFIIQWNFQFLDSTMKKKNKRKEEKKNKTDC
jgi:hypothetical protein